MLATEGYKRVPRDCCQIIDRLHLGSAQAAEQPEPLKELGVTHILCAAARIPAQYPKDFSYLLFDDVLDFPEQDLLTMLPEAIAYIEGALREGGTVLVICMAGISRSASVTIGYIMYSMGLKYKPAHELVQRARPAISPNPGFVRQLKQFRLMGFSTAAPPTSGELPVKVKAAYEGYAQCKRMSRIEKFAEMLTRQERIPSLAFATTPTTKRPGITYCCGSCKQPLFDPEHVMPHNKKKESLQCNAIFVQPMYWMIGKDAEVKLLGAQQQKTTTGGKLAGVDGGGKDPRCTQNQQEEMVAGEKEATKGENETKKEEGVLNMVGKGGTGEGGGPGDSKKGEGNDDSPQKGRAKVGIRRLTSHRLELEEEGSYFFLTNEDIGPLARWSGHLTCPGCATQVGCFNWVDNGCTCGHRMRPAFIAFTSAITRE